jgi:hypothetical protein
MCSTSIADENAEHEICRMSQYYAMQNEPILCYADCAWYGLLLALLGCLEPNH